MTGPSIKFINKNEVKGNNNWYKSLSVTTKLLDSSPIKSVKYCVTTDDNCTPNTPAEIENNSFTYQLLNDASIQTICIEATDNLDNVCTNCSKEEYKVDGEDPTITSVSVTPDDDTMTIEIVGEDDSSGIYAYYYSKDSGATYVKSKNSNYTFTNLEEGGYLITVYVEDAAGNTSLTSTGTTTIRHKDWCNHNGITNLAECAIATEARNTNIEEAKISIQNKSNPDFSKSSPSYVFSEKLSSGITTVSMDNKHIYYGDAYTIAEDSGTFSLLNRKNLILSEINLTENMDYYTCSSVESSNNCEKLFKIKKIEYNEQNNNYVIYKNDIIPEIRHYDTTESGMYAKEDDLGKSYYYRGIVGGNFVKFAGLYWRIIRVNGDGSVRLMYFSDKDTTQGKSAMVTKLNNSYWDPTYIGLMYNDRDFSESEITSQVGTYANIGENIIYSYGKSYSYDTNTKKYTLTGDIINGTWKDTYQQLLPKSVGSETEYYYTCFGTGASATSVCPVLMKITGYSNIKTAKVQYLSYTSTSYESATENISKSSLLTKLENWYTTNFANKRNDNGVLYTDYIKDSIFCNDRSLSPLTTGDGFNLAPATQYGAYYRVSSTKNPSLICPNLERDGFTLKASSVGNKTLDYPIGIVTIDEVALAGGIKGKINPLFYMNYQDNHLSLTLSPSVFAETFRTARVWGLYSTGSLNEYTNVGNGYDVRPVISVDPTKFTFTGTGTAEDPFVIE